MNYSSCVNVHRTGCEHYIDQLQCPVGCIGYVWNGIGEKEIIQVLVDGPAITDKMFKIPGRKGGY